MKKFLPVFFFLILTSTVEAQFVNGIGINGGVTFAKYRWTVKPDSLIPFYYDNSQKFKTSWNVAVFAEFLSDENWRWDSEIQYNHKGSIDVDKTFGHNYSDAQTHICWNNYLKYRYEIYYGIPYVFGGVRLEYLFSQSISSPYVPGAFHKFQVSPAVGAGWEFITYGQLKPFVEALYNPDIGLDAYAVKPIYIQNRAIEIRVGLRYEFGGGKERCPKVYK